MEEEIKVNFEVFISCDFNNANIFEIYNKLNEYFDKNEDISIIDVSNDYPSNFNEALCENVLKQINNTKLFICIITPKYNDDKQIFELNNNVLLELGYAISQNNADNVYIFVDQNTEKEFNQIKPTLIMHTKYITYIDHDEIIKFIEQKQNDFENETDSLKYKITNDKYLLSLIKYDLIKILNDNLKTSDKIIKIDDILNNYKHDDIFEIFFEYSKDYISHNQTDYHYINYYFYQIYNLEYFVWINKNNNQKKLLNFLNIFIHILFKKFGSLKTQKINKNRKNFILLLFDLLNSENFYYKDAIKKIIYESLKYNKNSNYKIYVYKLNGLYRNILYYTKIEKSKEHWEDLILNSPSKIFNNWFINYLETD